MFSPVVRAVRAALRRGRWLSLSLLVVLVSVAQAGAQTPPPPEVPFAYTRPACPACEKAARDYDFARIDRTSLERLMAGMPAEIARARAESDELLRQAAELRARIAGAETSHFPVSDEVRRELRDLENRGYERSSAAAYMDKDLNVDSPPKLARLKAAEAVAKRALDACERTCTGTAPSAAVTTMGARVTEIAARTTPNVTPTAYVCPRCKGAAEAVDAALRQKVFLSFAVNDSIRRVGAAQQALAQAMAQYGRINASLATAPAGALANAQAAVTTAQVNVANEVAVQRELEAALARNAADITAAQAALAACEKAPCDLRHGTGPTSARGEVMVAVGFGAVISPGSESPIDIVGGTEKIFPGGGLFVMADGRISLPNSPFAIGGSIILAPLGQGTPGSAGSVQNGRLIDGRMYFGADLGRFKLLETDGPQPVDRVMFYDRLNERRVIVRGGVGLAYVNYQQTSIAPGGASHHSQFNGLGPFIGVDIAVPLATDLPGSGVLFFTAAASGGPLVGSIYERGFGLDGSHSTLVWNANGSIGLGFALPSGLNIGVEGFYRHYTAIADGTLTSQTSHYDISRGILGIMARLSYALPY